MANVIAGAILFSIGWAWRERAKIWRAVTDASKELPKFATVVSWVLSLLGTLAGAVSAFALVQQAALIGLTPLLREVVAYYRAAATVLLGWIIDPIATYFDIAVPRIAIDLILLVVIVLGVAVHAVVAAPQRRLSDGRGPSAWRAFVGRLVSVFAGIAAFVLLNVGIQYLGL